MDLVGKLYGKLLEPSLGISVGIGPFSIDRYMILVGGWVVMIGDR